VDRTQTHLYYRFITPTIGYSGDYEWVLDTRATYHVCPNRD